MRVLPFKAGYLAPTTPGRSSLPVSFNRRYISVAAKGRGEISFTKHTRCSFFYSPPRSNATFVSSGEHIDARILVATPSVTCETDSPAFNVTPLVIFFYNWFSVFKMVLILTGVPFRQLHDMVGP